MSIYMFSKSPAGTWLLGRDDTNCLIGVVSGPASRQLPNESVYSPAVSSQRVSYCFLFLFFVLEDATLVLDRCHIQAPLVTFTKRSFVAVKEHTGRLLRRDAHAN